jgi:hypothetical protein
MLSVYPSQTLFTLFKQKHLLLVPTIAAISCQNKHVIYKTKSSERTRSPLRNVSSVSLCASSTEMPRGWGGGGGGNTSQCVMDSNMAAQ